MGYDLDGRTDIKWTFSFLIRLREKQAALNDIRDRFLALKSDVGGGAEVQRLSRQLTGKLDLAIAAVDEQIAALEQIGPGGFTLAEAANAITRGDGYNLVSAEPLIELLDELIAVRRPTRSRSAPLPALRPLEATGLGTSHIHLRVNAVQINNAFRAFVHEPWTRDLGERQALARIVEMIRNGKPDERQLRDARPRDGNRHPPVRARGADREARRSRHADPLPHRRMREPRDDPDRAILRQAVRRRRHRRHLAAV